jgi:hypothetical protein
LLILNAVLVASEVAPLISNLAAGALEPVPTPTLPVLVLLMLPLVSGVDQGCCARAARGCASRASRASVPVAK